MVAPTDNIAKVQQTEDLQWLLRARGGIHRFTVADVMQMIRSGVIPEDGTKELLNGVIVQKDRSDCGGDPLVHGDKHIAAIDQLMDLAARIKTSTRFARVQLPVICSEIEMPEPDFAMMRGRKEDYAGRAGKASEVLVVVEAADSSLERDGGEKLAIYAAAGIPQYLIINLRNSTIEQYTEPDTTSATYRTKATFTRGDTLTLNGGSDGNIEVRAAELLP